MDTKQFFFLVSIREISHRRLDLVSSGHARRCEIMSTQSCIIVVPDANLIQCGEVRAVSLGFHFGK